ncbi:hypothetical protein FJQ98_16045 [Lysinibacillus agricola]|uniref:Uncharacterized protein n=1 Tax=Lysinibacillus agricola TaxID=2590012 RepID=A0ABX7ANA1_9BACI|nr:MULTISPECIES: hypothetical protein [Lysinibacillus]KOS61545.1 hypothetical protein AN161_18320 [Lysinibacillus sp. FJAT-14222]QQP10757.1 hypothetical protein FJQ98_16045 [Lysinibacillus agricola]
MEVNNTVQLIIDLINEYDNNGGILTQKLTLKYAKKINELDEYKKLESKLDKIHKDLLQMKKVNDCKYVDIDYMLNAIENEKY